MCCKNCPNFKDCSNGDDIFTEPDWDYINDHKNHIAPQTLNERIPELPVPPPCRIIRNEALVDSRVYCDDCKYYNENNDTPILSPVCNYVNNKRSYDGSKIIGDVKPKDCNNSKGHCKYYIPTFWKKVKMFFI